MGACRKKGPWPRLRGQINLKDRVADLALQEFLAGFLPKYPGVRR